MKTRSGSKGLVVKVNLFSLEKFLDNFDSIKARYWIRGVVTMEGVHKMFNDAGELITILGKWNAKRFRELRRAKTERVKKIAS